MKFLVVDDHELVRDGLTATLAAVYGGVEVAQADSVATGCRLVRENGDFDLAILDMVLPDGSGIEIMDELERCHPEVPMIAVSGDDRFRDLAMQRGALGFLPKSADGLEVLEAVARVLSGQMYVPRSLSMLPASGVGSVRRAPSLTGRQLAVLRCIMKGLSNRDIAEALGLAESTIKVHVGGVLKALHVDNRTQAVLAARKLGLGD